jgi:hypothetical protein
MTIDVFSPPAIQAGKPEKWLFYGFPVLSSLTGKIYAESVSFPHTVLNTIFKTSSISYIIDYRG